MLGSRSDRTSQPGPVDSQAAEAVGTARSRKCAGRTEPNARYVYFFMEALALIYVTIMQHRCRDRVKSQMLPDSAGNVGNQRCSHLQVPGCDAELTRETKVYCLQRHICKAHLEV